LAAATIRGISVFIVTRKCRIVNYKIVVSLRPNLSRSAMLTKEFLFGLNILTLAGFAVMGLGVSLNRRGQIGVPLSIGLMCAGTALVFFGLYARGEGG
jgi:hypothetical protein